MSFTFWCFRLEGTGYVARPYLTLYPDMYVLYRGPSCIDNDSTILL